YHDLEAITAKVSAAIAARFDRRVAKAGKVAERLTTLVGELGECMEEEDVEIATLRGSRALSLLRSFRELREGTARFRYAYERFLVDHGDLVDAQTQATIGRFLAWLDARYAALHAHAAAYLERRNAHLTADRDQLAQ